MLLTYRQNIQKNPNPKGKYANKFGYPAKNGGYANKFVYPTQIRVIYEQVRI